MTRDDLIEAMARARWESLTGDMAWREVSAEAQYDQRRAMDAAADAAVAFVARWIEEHNDWGDEGAYENARKWREEMGA
jgi:hypothetical protein